MVRTEGITDLANPDAQEGREGNYTVVGYCTEDNLLGFKLDRPRAKPFRAAVALLSSVDGNCLQAHKPEHVETENVDGAVASFRKRVCAIWHRRARSDRRRRHN